MISYVYRSDTKTPEEKKNRLYYVENTHKHLIFIIRNQIYILNYMKTKKLIKYKQKAL